MKQKKIAVIGGGASGMMAAITAARNGGIVTIFEGNDRVGKKILSTGNGKCNFSNTDMSVDTHYYASDIHFLEKALSEFGVEESKKFFSDLGMFIYERDGYLYPASEQASTVLDLLRIELEKNCVNIVTETKIQELSINKNHGFDVKANGKINTFDAVIIACGSQAAPKTGSDGSGYKLAKKMGHTIKKPVPALVSLKCEQNLKAISGVRAKVSLDIMVDGNKVATEEGELQLTDYGISGIVVFQISRIAAYALQEQKTVAVKIDFLRDISSAEYNTLMKNRFQMLKDRTVEDYFLGMLNKKLIQYFIKSVGLKPEESIACCDKNKLEKVISLCKNFTLNVKDTNTFEVAQVCAGGVLLSELTDKMESKKHPGLYFAGEILDVDGKCGGYNLQWAWTSGYLAGLNSVK